MVLDVAKTNDSACLGPLPGDHQRNAFRPKIAAYRT